MISLFTFLKMNSVETKVNLIEAKGKLKQKFASLMDNHQLFAEGEKEEMFGKYQTNLSRTKDELQKIVSKL